jgi:hypothetical protein
MNHHDAAPFSVRPAQCMSVTCAVLLGPSRDGTFHRSTENCSGCRYIRRVIQYRTKGRTEKGHQIVVVVVVIIISCWLEDEDPRLFCRQGKQVQSGPGAHPAYSVRTGVILGEYSARDTKCGLMPRCLGFVSLLRQANCQKGLQRGIHR